MSNILAINLFRNSNMKKLSQFYICTRFCMNRCSCLSNISYRHFSSLLTNDFVCQNIKHRFSNNIKTEKQSIITSIRKIYASAPLLSQTVEFKLSDIGEGIREVTIKEWFVKPGDHVAQFDAICEVQSDKAAVTITSRYDGIIRKLHYEVDDTALVGNPLVAIDMDEGMASDSSGPEDMSDQEVGSAASSTDDAARLLSKVLATPAVRRLAMENKIRLVKVKGTGKDGRILKEDILEYIKASPKKVSSATLLPPAVSLKASVSTPAQKIVAISSPAAPVLKDDKTVKLKGIKKAMFKSMTAANSIPHFTYSDEVNLSRLVLLRNEIKEEVKHRYGVPLSFMPFFLKAMSLSLFEYPSLNAHLLDEDTVIWKQAHNIGVALDSPDGLLVPCVHNVQTLSILELAKRLDELVHAGRSGKLTQEELTGGTIALSNIGNIGGTYMKPVILPPQVCIGAVGRTNRVPRFNAQGSVVPAHILQVSWSADHRVVDGAMVARFSNHWKSLLESPDRFLLQLK